VLEYDGKRARYVTSLPSAVHRGWTSSSGAGYCCAVSGRHVYVYADGEWRQEQFSKRDEGINFIWGLSGSDWQGDVVYLTTDSKLFIRRDGQWSTATPPKSARPLFGLSNEGAGDMQFVRFVQHASIVAEAGFVVGVSFLACAIIVRRVPLWSTATALVLHVGCSSRAAAVACVLAGECATRSARLHRDVARLCRRARAHGARTHRQRIAAVARDPDRDEGG
jgi:hypothetical protein